MGTKKKKIKINQAKATESQTPKEMMDILTRFSELHNLKWTWRKTHPSEGDAANLKWAEIKKEIEIQCEQLNEDANRLRKTKTPAVKETLLNRYHKKSCEWLSKWDHPSRYVGLKFRIEAGLETSLSEDDKRTVLHALSHGIEVESKRREIKSLFDQTSQLGAEVYQWRVAWFEGDSKQKLKRIAALVKKLGLTPLNYADGVYSKSFLVAVCYRVLSNLPVGNGIEVLEKLVGGRTVFDAVFLPLPDMNLSGKEAETVKRKAVEKTRDIFNLLVEAGKLKRGFMFVSDYSCYQFLRNECKIKSIPKFQSENHGGRKIDEKLRIILQNSK